MQVGDLVEMARARIGIPANTVGVVLGVDQGDVRYDLEYFEVQLFGLGSRHQLNIRRFLSQDLKVLA